MASAEQKWLTRHKTNILPWPSKPRTLNPLQNLWIKVKALEKIHDNERSRDIQLIRPPLLTCAIGGFGESFMFLQRMYYPIKQVYSNYTLHFSYNFSMTLPYYRKLLIYLWATHFYQGFK